MADLSNAEPQTADFADCPFCIEFNDIEASEFRRLFSRTELASRTLAEDSDFAVIAGIGAFNPGYILLIPKSHFSSFAQLPSLYSSRADAWWHLSMSKMRHHFGEIVLFEHGGTAANMAGGCIDHAHIHLIATAVDVMSEMNRRISHVRVPSLSKLPAVTSGRPYVLVQQGDSMEAYFPRERLPSQYMRRLILELEGRPDVWDWALFPGKENMLKTIQSLSSSKDEDSWLPNV